MDKEYDERNPIKIIDDKESDERYQTGENDEERLTGGIAVLKLWKLSSKRYIDNIDKEC